MSVKPSIGAGNISNLYFGTTLLDKAYQGDNLFYLRPSLKITNQNLALEVAKSVFYFQDWEFINEGYDFFYFAGYDSRQRDIFVYKIDHDVRTSTKAIPCTNWENAKDRVIWYTTHNMGGTWVSYDKPLGPYENDTHYFVSAMDSKYNEVVFLVSKSNSEVLQEF